MKKEFDFDSVGKKMPYNVSDTFFSTISEDILATARKRKKASLYKRVITFSIGIAAMIAIIFIINLPNESKNDVSKDEAMATQKEVNIDDLLIEVPDKELEELVVNMETDVFSMQF